MVTVTPPQEGVKSKRQAEALHRARSNTSLSNYPAIIRGFIAKGISEDDIQPRVNVFTYPAWKALGRQVRKGEHGVKVLTYIEFEYKEKDDKTDDVKPKTSRRPRNTTVFHITQTDEIQGVQSANV